VPARWPEAKPKQGPDTVTRAVPIAYWVNASLRHDSTYKKEYGIQNSQLEFRIRIYIRIQNQKSEFRIRIHNQNSKLDIRITNTSTTAQVRIGNQPESQMSNHK
jgi:hypothetical protein